jgi:amino acid permease
MPKNYFYAIATLIGTTIGVGLFSIPYVASKAGVIPLLFYFIVLVSIQYYLHKLFAEIVLSTKTEHRIPGYAGKYQGRKHKIFASIIAILGLNGTILAYLIVAGIFLHNLVNHFFSYDIGLSAFFYSTIIFIIISSISFFGLRILASVEFFLAGLLILFIFLLIWRSFGLVDLSNYDLVHWEYILFPYGPIFFAIGGITAIPYVCKLLERKKEKIKSAIFWGTFISSLIIIIFTLLILGVTGEKTTPDSLTGLGLIIGNGILAFSLAFGVISITTSFLVVAQTLREVYYLDLKIDKNISWALACFIPYLLFLMGVHNFTKVIGLTGSVVGGLLGIILVFLALKVKENPERESIIKNKLNKPIAYALSLLFILGLIYEIWAMFKNGQL